MDADDPDGRARTVFAEARRYVQDNPSDPASA
jgi:hypothetical protein